MRKGIVWVIVLGMLIALTGCQAAKAKKSNEAAPDAAQAVEGQPALGEPITLEDGTVVYPVDPQQVITAPDGSQQVIYQEGPAPQPQPQTAPQTTPQGTVYKPIDKTGKVVTPSAQPAPQAKAAAPQVQAAAPQEMPQHQHHAAVQPTQAVEQPQKVIRTKDNYPPGTIIMNVNGQEKVVLPKGSLQLQPGQPQVVFPDQTAPQAEQPQVVSQEPAQPQVVSQEPAQAQAAPQGNVPLGVVYPQQNQ